MSSNPPPSPTTRTTSQSDSKTQYISHERDPQIPPLPPIPLPQSYSTDQETKDELFQKAMREDWDAVVKIYEDKKDIVWTAKITRSKETALHIAISDSKTEVAKKLLDIIDPIKIREMVNDKDENPLHLAASLGQAETCKKLVEKDPELIGARNKEGETPLFQAALHGKKKAFYALHPKCPINEKDIKHDIVHCKRNDGNSILHVAIQGEYLGLAYQIIHWYPELIKFNNEKGLTALHLLAQNPSAFRSGCHLGPFDDFTYRCLIVDLDEVEMPSHFRDEHCSDFEFEVPGNYQTCLDLLNMWKSIFTAIATWARKWEDIKHDTRKIFNKDVDKQLPVTSTGKDKKQEPEDPNQGKIFEDSSKHCDHSHIDIEGKDKKQATEEPSQDKKCDRSHIDIKAGDEMKKKEPQIKGQKGEESSHSTPQPQKGSEGQKGEESSHSTPQPQKGSEGQKEEESSHSTPQPQKGSEGQEREESSHSTPQPQKGSEGQKGGGTNVSSAPLQKEKEIQKGSQEEEKDSTEQPQYPSNYNVFFNLVEFAMEFFLFVLGLGYFQVRKIKEKKQKHKLACQIMKKLVYNAKFWVYDVGSGSAPVTGHSSVFSDSLQTEPPVDASEHSTEDEEKMVKDILSALPGKEVLLEAEKTRPDVYRLKMLKNDSQEDRDHINRSPVLIAVKMGVKEMVEEILNKFPVAIRDEDADNKNVVLLAVENKHPKIYKLLLNKYYNSHESVFQKVDKDGNSAIHLAATIGKNQFWRIPGAALQMQWELKWHKYIKTSMPRHFFAHRNKEGKTSMEVFEETHEGIIKEGVQWLNNTSQSCSVIAALIASVAYASAATVPGGDNQYNGIPILKGEASFNTFIIASLVALCFSVTSLTIFLSVLTTNYTIHVHGFLHNLPMKLLLGLTTLFISIGAMLVSFCAGHFINIGDRNRNIGSPVFAIICLPVSAYVLTQFHLLISLIKVPF